jgi:RNA polymerase sigma factor (sigma-70 family)
MIDSDSLQRRLQAEGIERDDAIVELRGMLLRGLSTSLNNRYGQAFSAEDIVQDALIKILDSMDQFQGRCQFTTWAMTIAIRIGMSALRRKYHQDVSMESFRGEDGYRIEIAVANEQGDLGERSLMIAKLQQLIDTDLTDKQRMAMRAFLAGMSTDGIADRTGTNRNAVYKLIHDARVKLKSGLQRLGVSADDVQEAFGYGLTQAR